MRPFEVLRRISVAGDLHIALDLACFEAGGAHIHTLGHTVDESLNALDIRVPATRGAHMRVRDILAETGLLAADVTNRCHDSLLFAGG